MIVLVGQADAAFKQKEFQKAEALLLRAQRLDLAVKHYKVNRKKPPGLLCLAKRFDCVSRCLTDYGSA